MKTNDLKKGIRVQLRNGWMGTMADNARGNTRMVDVEGICREIGSVYSHDIVRAKAPAESSPAGIWQDVEHTPAQLKIRERVAKGGF
jgi:hypothetical protein